MRKKYERKNLEHYIAGILSTWSWDELVDFVGRANDLASLFADCPQNREIRMNALEDYEIIRLVRCVSIICQISELDAPKMNKVRSDYPNFFGYLQEIAKKTDEATNV